MMAHTNQRGFSLIEAMISMVIISVVVLALIQFQSGSLTDSGDSRVRTHALNSASEKLEQLRSASGTGTYSGIAASSSADVVSAGSADLSRTWSVTDHGGYKEATVSVVWNDTKGKQQSVVLSTYIEDADPVKAGRALLLASGGMPTSPGVPGGGDDESDGDSDSGAIDENEEAGDAGGTSSGNNGCWTNKGGHEVCNGNN